MGRTRLVAGGVGSDFFSGCCLGIRATPAQEKSISFAQPRGLTKGYFCPHLVHQTACSLSRTRTFESVAQIRAASHTPTGAEHFWQKPDIRRVETLEVHERPANIDPKGRPRVHHAPCLESRSTAGAAPRIACYGVRSHADAVALVIECSMPVV